MPRAVKITGADVREALSDTVQLMVGAARSVLERTPPELPPISPSVPGARRRRGRPAGLDKVLREETGIPAIVAEDPLLAVVNGVGIVLEDLDRYRGLLF